MERKRTKTGQFVPGRATGKTIGFRLPLEMDSRLRERVGWDESSPELLKDSRARLKEFIVTAIAKELEEDERQDTGSDLSAADCSGGGG